MSEKSKSAKRELFPAKTDNSNSEAESNGNETDSSNSETESNGNETDSSNSETESNGNETDSRSEIEAPTEDSNTDALTLELENLQIEGEKKDGEWLKNHKWEKEKPDSTLEMEATVSNSGSYPTPRKWTKNRGAFVDLAKIYSNLPSYVEDVMKGGINSCRQELERVLQTPLSELALDTPHVFEIKNESVPSKDQTVPQQEKYTASSLISQPKDPEVKNFYYFDCEHMLKMYVPGKKLSWFQTQTHQVANLFFNCCSFYYRYFTFFRFLMADDSPPTISPMDNCCHRSPRRDSERCYLSCRYVLAGMSCSGFCVVYLLRVNLSVALVAMVNSTYADAKATANNPECQRNTANVTRVKDGEFKWDQEMQGLILGAFFYGYIVTQLPGGWLASRYGGKVVFGCGVLLTSVAALFTPAAAYHSVAILMLVRVVEGLGQGVTFPAMQAMWGYWAPPLERSKLVTISYAGLSLGTVLAMPISGLLCASNLWGGWPAVFYIFGAIGILWAIMWLMLTHDRPEDHPRISAKEKEYIQSSIGSGDDAHARKYKTPWLKIWRSPAVWAIVVANVCDNWGFYTFLTGLPSYLKEVLNFSIQENGFVSALPYILSFIGTIGSGQLADWLRNKRILTTGEARKVFGTAGFLIPAFLLVSTSYVGCDNTSLAVVLFTLALGVQSFNSTSYSVNHLDIAPRFAGILVGITNSFGTVPGIVGPYIIGYLTDNQPTRAQWQKVFYISAGVFVFGWFIYLLLGSGEQQSWNTPYEDVLVPVDFPGETRKPAMAADHYSINNADTHDRDHAVQTNS